MRRTRGFTLMEILIAMALTTIVTASVLAIVRTQLTAFEMEDQIVRTQQNSRAGMDFIESIVRRACSGINSGTLYVYAGPSTILGTSQYCLRVTDGAVATATGFTSTSKNNPDALDVVYASGAMTAVTNSTVMTTMTSTTPSVDVLDTCNFSIGDFVIVTDASYANPALFQVSAVGGTGTCPAASPRAGTLSLGTVNPAPTAAKLPVMSAYSATAGTAGTPVFKAYTYSIFVSDSTINTSANAAYDHMLMVDPAGITSTNHLNYTNVQPAVEGVIDFQVAVGQDNSGTNAGTMDWLGDSWGETLDYTKSWNSATLTTLPQYRQVRLSLLLRTSNLYPGTPGTITQLEDRPFASYPPFTPGQNSQRYRSISMIVAPRAWNLAE